MVAVIGIVIAAAAFSLFLIAGFLATFLPGLAVLQFARAKKSFLGKVAGLGLLAAPLIVVAGSEERFVTYLRDHNADFAYALCFFPGLLFLLHKARSETPHLGFRACMSYLVALLIMTLFASIAAGAYGASAVFALLGIFFITAFGGFRPQLLNLALGAALLGAPVAATWLMALPRHLELNSEMAAACASGAGLSIAAPSAPVSVIAMDMAGIYDGSEQVCARVRSTPPHWRFTPPHGCFAPVAEGLLTGIEVGGDGWHPYGVPEGLYRYQARLPEAVQGADLSPRVKSKACDGFARFDDTQWCVGPWPIEALTADYMVRRSSVPSFEAIYSESFEIVESSSGETVAQTTGFYMTDGNRDSVLAAPLHHILPREDACVENGPPFLPFIEAFVEASR